MNRIVRLAQVIGLNSVPVVGVFWKDWSDSSAVVFFWCETALLVIFVSLRLVIHQRLTMKRGHYVESRTSVNGGPWKSGISTYNRSFLLVAVGFGMGNLVFIAVLFGLFPQNVQGGEVDLLAIRNGVLVAAAFIFVAFLFDLPRLRRQPFANVQRLADGVLQRVFILYAAIFIGVFCAMVLNIPRALFAVFFGLKLFIDIASNFKQYDPQQPPKWIARMSKDPKFVETWQAERMDRMSKEREDELPFAGEASRSVVPRRSTFAAGKRGLP